MAIGTDRALAGLACAMLLAAAPPAKDGPAGDRREPEAARAPTAPIRAAPACGLGGGGTSQVVDCCARLFGRAAPQPHPATPPAFGQERTS